MKKVRTYTLKEVSKIIDVSVSTIKHWEKEFNGLLDIPRSKQGARLYTNNELEQLIEINQLYQRGLNSEEIQNNLENKLPSEPEPVVNHSESVPVPSDKEIASSDPNEVSPRNIEYFFAAMDQYKQTFLSEVKNEIKKAVETEVVEEIKKEISKGALETVKNISESIYKSNASAMEEVKELSFNIQKHSTVTAETYKTLERSIADQSLETSEEFYTIAKQLAQTSEELAHYIDVTNNEISCLSEALEREREYFMEDREQFRHEIRQRELAFQSMLSGYRYAAPSKGKKWWRLW